MTDTEMIDWLQGHMGRYTTIHLECYCNVYTKSLETYHVVIEEVGEDRFGGADLREAIGKAAEKMEKP